MKLSIKSEFGERVSEFSYINSEFYGSFADIIHYTLKCLSKYGLFKLSHSEIEIKYVTPSKNEDSPPRIGGDLWEYSNFAAILHGTGYIIGEGDYNDSLYINFRRNNEFVYITIIVTVTNFLEYDMDGKPNQNYQENKERMVSVLSELDQVMSEEAGWTFDIEPTMYAAVSDDGRFIESALNEDTGEPLVISSIVTPLIYEPTI